MFVVQTSNVLVSIAKDGKVLLSLPASNVFHKAAVNVDAKMYSVAAKNLYFAIYSEVDKNYCRLFIKLLSAISVCLCLDKSYEDWVCFAVFSNLQSAPFVRKSSEQN